MATQVSVSCRWHFETTCVPTAFQAFECETCTVNVPIPRESTIDTFLFSWCGVLPFLSSSFLFPVLPFFRVSFRFFSHFVEKRMTPNSSSQVFR